MHGKIIRSQLLCTVGYLYFINVGIPKIINNTENQQLSVVSGREVVTLTCEITGDDITGGYWERVNDDPLPARNNISSLSNDKTIVTMTIRRVRSGGYHCVIYSPWGVAQSANIVVTVTSKRISRLT